MRAVGVSTPIAAFFFFFLGPVDAPPLRHPGPLPGSIAPPHQAVHSTAEDLLPLCTPPSPSPLTPTRPQQTTTMPVDSRASLALGLAAGALSVVAISRLRDSQGRALAAKNVNAAAATAEGEAATAEEG